MEEHSAEDRAVACSNHAPGTLDLVSCPWGELSTNQKNNQIIDYITKRFEIVVLGSYPFSEVSK